MTKETKKRIHLIYGILVSIAAVVAGICFIVSAYSIYTTGLAANVQPYTVATIGAAFSKIAVPVYIFLALMAGGIVLNVVLPQDQGKPPVEKNSQLILQRLQAKTDLSQCDAGLRKAIEAQEKARKLHWLISGVLLVIASALFLSYACNGNNWAPVDQAALINTCMVRAVFAMFLCLSVPFIYIVFTVFFCRKSLTKQIELMRQANAQAPRPAEKQPAKAKGQKAVAITRYAILAVALGMIVYGAIDDGTLDVLAKAAAICTECVGLG